MRARSTGSHGSTFFATARSGQAYACLDIRCERLLPDGQHGACCTRNGRRFPELCASMRRGPVMRATAKTVKRPCRRKSAHEATNPRVTMPGEMMACERIIALRTLTATISRNLWLHSDGVLEFAVK